MRMLEGNLRTALLWLGAVEAWLVLALALFFSTYRVVSVPDPTNPANSHVGQIGGVAP